MILATLRCHDSMVYVVTSDVLFSLWTLWRWMGKGDNTKDWELWALGASLKKTDRKVPENSSIILKEKAVSIRSALSQI